jgi:hypothetical protein
MQKTPHSAAGGAMSAALTSRRALLAGLAVAPAAIGANVALPLHLAAAAMAPDPIFDIVVKWQSAKDEMNVAVAAHSSLEEMEGTNAGKADPLLANRLASANRRVARAHLTYNAACRNVFGTVPSSNEGLLALLAVWRDDHDGCGAEEDEIELLVGRIETFAKGGTLTA